MTIEKRKSEKEKKMTVKLQPMADRVVVKPIQSEEKTKSGIYIPDTAKEKPQEGKVIAVGPGRMTDEGKTNCPGCRGRRHCNLHEIWWL